MTSRLGWVSARLFAVAFFLLTSLYGLFAFVPFTYQQIIQVDFIPAVGVFARLHPLLYWMALACAALTLVGDLRPGTWGLSVGFLACGVAAGVALLAHPLLVGLGNELSSLVWSLVALVPIFWLAAIDWVGSRRALTWAREPAQEDGRIFGASLLSGCFLALLYLAFFYIRFGGVESTGLNRSDVAIAGVVSVLSHLVLFMALFAALALIHAAASFFRTPPRAEFALCTVLGVATLAFVLRNVVLSTISLAGAAGALVAIATAAAIVATAAGLAIRARADAGGFVNSGVQLALSPLVGSRSGWSWLRGVSLAALIGLAYIMAVGAAVMDWNYVLQKLGALVVWALTFSIFYSLPARRTVRSAGTVPLLLAAVASLGAYRTAGARQQDLSSLAHGAHPDVSVTIDKYAGYDPSFKVIHDLINPRRRGSESEGFYTFLQKNTNIPRTVTIEPTDVRLVPSLTATEGAKPNIFVFVIDSLRRDYLSPYNETVTFTPSIARFASDSVVFRNAFTRYGATGLSEPSIWVGGLLPHQQYVTPFRPMNSLEKLVQAEAYLPFVSIDTVLRAMDVRPPDLIELDANVSTKDYDFCRSLQELGEKVRERPSPSRPVFAYTQPQNIHISTITREGTTAPTGESYPGFYAPYAARIRRMDACFGEFVQGLQAEGLYENSIIILTSDHGDSLGEDGRWGHAYTVFPEIVQIPLLIHLPEALRRLSVDTGAVAFETDITPTLYYLLGHRPTLNNTLFGRPLLTESPQERAAYLRDSYLLASSYGPVYGILSGRGDRLYVVDAVNYVDYQYDLREAPTGTRNTVTEGVRAENQRLIRDGIDEITRFYRVPEMR